MKIRHVTYYICQFCEKKFISEEECKQHEANEMNLTIEEYKELEELEKKEMETSKVLAVSSNQELRDNQDKAIRNVTTFRKKHNLGEDEILIHI